MTYWMMVIHINKGNNILGDNIEDTFLGVETDTKGIIIGMSSSNLPKRMRLNNGGMGLKINDYFMQWPLQKKDCLQQCLTYLIGDRKSFKITSPCDNAGSQSHLHIIGYIVQNPTVHIHDLTDIISQNAQEKAALATERLSVADAAHSIKGPLETFGSWMNRFDTYLEKLVNPNAVVGSEEIYKLGLKWAQYKI
ncbi:MAG: hypothetical protein ABIF10_01225 [Candidatus Woesearchaeota archaeon]